MKDLNSRVPCSVSQELVDMIADSYPNNFKNKKGDTNIPKLLFYIGFKIDHSMKTLGYYKNFDVFIRDNTNPSKLYKTSCVYNGEVRNRILKIDPSSGKILYTKIKHSSLYLYEQVEVLHPLNIKDIIPEEDFIDILDIGDPNVYDRAFLTKDRTKKTLRNIVRSS